MVLAFYSVESKFDRHAFDCYDTTKKEDCIEIFKKLSGEKPFHYYAMDLSKTQPDANSFEEDYNNEMLDGGLWVVVLYALTDKDIDAMKGITIYVSNIQWDVDEDDDPGLPFDEVIGTNAELKDKDDVEEFVSNFLSDTYGYCHKGFVIDSIEW